jgi:hypothetical protein
VGRSGFQLVDKEDTYLVQVSASVDPKNLSKWMEDDDDVKSIELNKHLKQSSQKGQAPAVTSTSPTATYFYLWQQRHRCLRTAAGLLQQHGVYRWRESRFAGRWSGGGY